MTRTPESAERRAAGGLPGPERARVRALAAWSAAAAGMLTASTLPEPVHAAVWFGVAAAAALGAAMVRGSWVRACFVVAAFALAAGWFTARILTPDPLCLPRVLGVGPGPPNPPTLATVEAVVTRPVRGADPPQGLLGRFAQTEPRQWFLASIRTAEVGGVMEPARGEVSVWVAGEAPLRLTPGERVRITGLYAPTAPALNPGQPDRARWAAQAGRAGSMSLTGASLVVPVPHGSAGESAVGAARAALWWFRGRGESALRAAAGEDPRASALVRALILGEADPALDETTAAFSRLGVVHILSISGFHVSAMALFAAFLLRLPGERGRWQTALLAVPVAGYLLLVPAEAPVVRAGALALVVIAAELLGRRYDAATLLIWTSLAILAWRPMDLWSLGYQLSCGMTLALLWIGPRAHVRVWGSRVLVPGAWRRWTPHGFLLASLRSSVSVGLLCWSLSAPAVWCRTGLVSAAAVAAGVLLAPVFGALMYAAFAVLAVGLVAPEAVSPASGVLGSLARAAVALAGWIDGWPGASVYAPPIPWWSAAVVTALVGWAWVRGRARSPGFWAAASLGVAVLAAGVASRGWLPRGVVLRIDTLAVGDGTCHVLRSGGEAMLWDCGSLRPGLGVRELPAALRAVGVWRAPTAVISHGDFDHYAALPDVARAVGLRRVLVVERLLRRAEASPRGPLACLLGLLRERGVEVVALAAGEAVELGRVRLTVLSPPVGADWPVENDHSLVARVDDPSAAAAGPALAVLTGDVEAGAIALIRERFPTLRARVVEAPHHGSARAEAARWVESLEPAVVVQSTGPRRVGGRSAEVWAEVRRRARWLTTAESGAMVTEVFEGGAVRAEPAAR